MSRPSRTPSRLLLLLFILTRFIQRLLASPRKPSTPKRILVLHHLFLGDTLMVTALLAKLRQQYPTAEITTVIPDAFTGLFSSRPYDVEALPYNPRKASSLWSLLRLKPYDLAFIPGDNRYGWIAFAMGARWICGFSGDRPDYKNWCFNELIDYPESPAAWTDILTELVAPGIPVKPFQVGDWPVPDAEKFSRPSKPYVLLHVGTKSRLKAWPAKHWNQVIAHFEQKGRHCVISCGPGEEQYAKPLQGHNLSLYPGTLNLLQLWSLMAEAEGIICLDNGVGHLARLSNKPTVCLFGPASSQLFGDSHFWSQIPFLGVTIPIDCRNQHTLFKRQIDWIMTCRRTENQCQRALCMENLSPEQVIGAYEKLQLSSPPGVPPSQTPEDDE